MKQTSWKIIYKLLADCLFLELLFLAFALILDGLIPGFITDHISFLKIVLLLGITFGFLYISSRAAGLEIQTENFSNKKTAVVLAILAALLIFNSLWKLNLWLALFILAIILVTFYYLYKNILSQKA